MQEKKVRTLVYSAMLAALTLAATLFLKIPTAIGYVNLGDGVILFGGALLGAWPAAAAGALGSALADLLAGYVTYAPATFLIKGCMGFLAGLTFSSAHEKAPVIRRALCFAGAEILMAAGYFFFEWALYGVGAAAGSVIPNLGQGAMGLCIGLVLYPAAGKVRALSKL